ncbi:peptide deformylase [Lentibacillus salinarum]|uniref:Peptide deformylase n=1 Tax=Lentibacillus salinarum TaxID=446820 RepID=A0ABW3ZUL4_9BACI
MITMNDIVREGHPSLREKAEEVTVPPTENDIQLLNDMLTFIKNSQDEDIAGQYHLRPGVGLAAPQLGINKRMCAVHFEDLKGRLCSYGLINPKIVSHSVEQAYLSTGEGCLSVDRDVQGYVPRNARVTVKAIGMDGQELKLRLRDYAAIVVQHEIDHLNGVMFYDYINPENPFTVPDNSKPIG